MKYQNKLLNYSTISLKISILGLLLVLVNVFCIRSQFLNTFLLGANVMNLIKLTQYGYVFQR